MIFGLNLQDGANLAAICSAVITLFGFATAFFQIKLLKEQSITTFEDSLTNEYRRIMEKLPLEALIGEELSEDNYLNSIDYFYQYFDLCNNQIFLYNNGRISKPTWAFWREGIQSNLSKPAFSKAWNILSQRTQNDLSELRRTFPPNLSSTPQEGVK